MSNRRWFRWSLGGLTVVGLAWACQDTSRIVTPSKTATARPAFDVASPVLHVGQFILCKSTPEGTHGTFEVDVFLGFPGGGSSSEGDFLNDGECRLVKTVDQSQSPMSVSAFENNGIAGTSSGFLLESVTIITGSGTVTLPGAGTQANPATCTVTLTTGCVIVFNNAPKGFGRMTGGGSSITVGGISITKGLTLHCDITLSNNLEINWAGHHWHLDKPITSADCVDDPAIDPAPPPAPFDTFNGTAVGQLDGVDGSNVIFTFVDAGEPGGKGDKAAIKIFDPSGNVVLELALSLITGGNLQAHFDQPHGCNVNKC